MGHFYEPLAKGSYMKKHIFISLILCFNLLVSFGQEDTRAESIEYDPIGNRFLASIGASQSIVQIDPQGNSSLFGEGLFADLGMEIIGNNLYAITFGVNPNDPANLIKVFDLTLESEILTYQVPNAQELNGMASDGISRLCVTETNTSRIIEVDFSDLSNPTSQVLATVNNIGLNGITFDEDNNRLVFVSFDFFDSGIRELNLDDNSVNILIADAGISDMDGIDMDLNGIFYISSFTPSRITKFNNDFSSSEIINVPGINNPADICIANEISILAIPSFQHDVILYPLSNISSVSDLAILNPDYIRVFPSLLTSENLNIEISEKHFWNHLDYKIYDSNGKLVKQASTNSKRFIINSLNLNKGMYFIQFIFDRESVATKMFNIM